MVKKSNTVELHEHEKSTVALALQNEAMRLEKAGLPNIAALHFELASKYWDSTGDDTLAREMLIARNRCHEAGKTPDIRGI